MNPEKLEKQLLFLKWYVAVLTMVICALLIFMRSGDGARFKELTVEKIDVVDKEGNVRVQLAGAFPPRRTELAGLLFHNKDGSEAGGLVYSGRKTEGQVSAGSVLTMDQYNNDQIVVLRYEEENGKRNHGLWIADRPDSLSPEVLAAFGLLEKMPEGSARDSVSQALLAKIPPEQLVARRLFVGRDKDKAATVELSDRHGAPRLLLQVDSLGNGRISFLDADGNVVHTIP